MISKTSTLTKNLGLFLVPLLIPLFILGAFSIVLTRHYIQEEIKINNFNLLQQIRKNLELVFDELDSLNLNLGTKAEIVLTLKRIFNNPEPKISFEDYRSLTTITNLIDAPANARPYIHSIYVYFDNDYQKVLTTLDGLTQLNLFPDQSWYPSYLKNKFKDPIFWSESRVVQEYAFKNPTEVWTIYRKIYSTSGYKESIGVIVLNIYTEYLRNLLTDLGMHESQNLLITTTDGQLIFTSDKTAFSMAEQSTIEEAAERSFTQRIKGIDYVITHLFSEKYGLKYTFLIPLKVLYQVPAKLQSLTGLLLLISFGLGLALTYYLTRRNHNQVKDIITIIDSAKNGWPLPQFPSSVNDEYSYITHNILTSFIEQNYLKVQLSERKYRLQVMEMLALQSQINPHFLFNTLETIRWKIIQCTTMPNLATKMVEDLAHILHYSLESPGKMVTVAEEIHHTRNYIEIQKIRYQNKFNIIWEYDEEVKPLPMIRLIFQPLLENSIYHGIKEKAGQSTIKIKIRNQISWLSIAIIDNGLGITGDQLARIIKSLASDKNDGAHIGLYNTNKRLTLTYGEEAAIRIRSKVNRGTVISFKIPLDPKKITDPSDR